MGGYPDNSITGWWDTGASASGIDSGSGKCLFYHTHTFYSDSEISAYAAHHRREEDRYAQRQYLRAAGIDHIYGNA